jgi:tetratricopeptide (TPR) repeat protein
VIPLYPRKPDHELYEAVAQVRDLADLAVGIPRLRAAVVARKPKEPGFYYELGEALRNGGRPREAISWYEKSLDRRHHFTPALLGLGAAWRAAGDLDRAIAVLERVSEHDVATLNALGAAYKDRGRLAEGVAAFRRAIAANPDVPEPHLNLGATLAAAGDPEGAIAAFRQAIRVRPDLAAAHNDLAVLLDRRGETPLAREHFERSIRLDPGYAAARHNYGLHLARQAQWAAARAQFEKAVELEPTAAAHTNLATVLAKSGDSVAAIGLYQRAIAIDGSFEPARLNLARTLLASGRSAEALPYLRALADSSSSETRTAARELLQLASSR